MEWTCLRIPQCRLFTLMMALSFGLVTSSPKDIALIVVDVQRCFMEENGPLHVMEGENVVPNVNNIRMTYGGYISVFVLVKDEHCENHVAFTSQHPGKEDFERIMLEYDEEGQLCDTVNTTLVITRPCHQVAHRVEQILWPEHCIMGTPEAEFAVGLINQDHDIIIRTGNNCQVDSYSAFRYNGGFLFTDLHPILISKKITRVVITGVALEYGVSYTALDAKNLGFETFIVLDATARANDSDEDSFQWKLKDLELKGIHLIKMADLGDDVFFERNVTSQCLRPRPTLLLQVALPVLLASLLQPLRHHLTFYSLEGSTHGERP